MQLDLELHPAQMQVFTCPARYIVLAAGRRTGKTVLGRARAITSALSTANTQQKPVFIVAPTQAQAKFLYWDPLVRSLQPVIKSVNVNEGLIYLQNDVTLGVKGADRPETLLGAGLFDVIMDEYGTMKANVWPSIIRPMLTDVKGRALFIGSPAENPRNHFYHLWEKARTGAAGAEWAAFHYTTLDNPFLPREEIEAARRDLSSAEFRRQFLASFDTASSDVFRQEWVKRAEKAPTRERKGAKNGEREEIPGDWYVAVDIGSLAGHETAVGYQQKRLDQTAIAVVKVCEDGTWWVRDVYLGRWTEDETVRRIAEAVESCQPVAIGIEKGALFNVVAPKVRAELHRRRRMAQITPLTHDNTSKVHRITWALQGKMEHGRLVFREAEWNREVEDQLFNFPSPQIHDDALDALAYIDQLAKDRNWFNVDEVEMESNWVPVDPMIGY